MINIYMILPIMYPLFLYNFNENLIVLADFRKMLKYKI
jgi:hypothetical protein